MEFKIPVKELQIIVSKLSNVIKMNADDISSMIYIEAANNELKFKGSSGFVHVIISANDFEIIESGKLLCKLIDIKGYISKFLPLSEGYGTDFFHFISNDSEGTIKAKTLFRDGRFANRKLVFDLYNYEERPIKPFGEPQFIVNSNILKQGIEKVFHCVDPNEVRSALKGISITIDDGKVTFAGTNGVKLVESIVSTDIEISKLSKLFRYDLSNVLYLLLENDSQVFINIEGSIVYVKSDNMYIAGQLIIDSTYPDYTKLFECKETIVVPRTDFVDSIFTLLEVLDSEDNNRLTLCFDGNKFIVKNNKAESEHIFDRVFKTKLDIDVNGIILASLLKDITGEYLEINFTKGDNCVIFKTKDSDDHRALITVVNRR